MSLFEAVGAGDVAAISNLVAAGHAVSATDDMRWQPIHKAAEKPDDASANLLVTALVEAGADVNAEGGEEDMRCTPLHIAAANGHRSTVETLLARGADIHVLDGVSIPAPAVVLAG